MGTNPDLDQAYETCGGVQLNPPKRVIKGKIKENKRSNRRC